MTQLEFTIGEEYNHYIVPHHAYTTRFDIFYNSENVGYVENEELTPNANSEWVIHIPTDKRAFLESKNKGLVGAIFDLPTNQDGIIDKKYYIEPVAFTRIIGKDYNNTPHQIDAKGPGAYVGLKFDNEFFKVEDTEIAQGTKQLNISIDLKSFANVLRYTLAEVSGNLPSGVVTDPQGISIRTCDRFPSIIVAEDNNSRPSWKELKDITVGHAAEATNTEMFGYKRPEDFVTYKNINSDITSYFDNSYEYGFRTGYDLEKEQSYVYTRAYRVHLVGDVSGDAEVHNFEDIDIETKIADQSKLVFIKNVEDGTEFHSGLRIKGPVTLAYGNEGPYSTASTSENPRGEVIYSQVTGLMAFSDMWRMGAGSVASDRGFLEIATGDNADSLTSEAIYVSQYRGNKFDTLVRRAALLDSDGNTSFPGTVTSAGLTAGDLTISTDRLGNTVFDISRSKEYKFNINGINVLTLDERGTPYDSVYAKLVSPHFTGTPTAPTPESTDNSDKIATTEYVKANVPVSIGSDVTPVYTNENGVITASNATVGSETVPVYIKDGVITSTDVSFIDYATKESPILTGIPTAPTADAGTNNNQVATTEFVQIAIDNLVNGAPEQLDTLKELADALNNNADIANALTENLASKIDRISDGYIKELSIDGQSIIVTKGDGSQDTLVTKDTTYADATSSKAGLMSAEDKAKLDTIEANANAYTYTLPVANSSTLGGIKVGTNLSIDNNGVLSAKDTVYINATSAISGLMSAADKAKLDTISENANNFTYTLPKATASVLGGIKVGTNLSIDADGVLSADAQAYAEASTSSAGLMSASDKTKLNSIASNANNYTLPTASSTTLGGIKVGSNLSISNGVLSATDTTYGVATATSDGLMSAADKTKLNNIAASANNYSLPTASSSTLGGIKVGSNLSIANGVLSATDTTYSAATTSAAGLMTAADKTKLNGIASGANAYSLPTASASTLGGIKVGSGLTITNGTLSVSGSSVFNSDGHLVFPNNDEFWVAT